MSNNAIADALREIGKYLALQDVPFKPRAYEKAADAVAGFEKDLATVYASGGKKALEAIPGVGISIAGSIVEMLTTGRIAQLDDLRKKIDLDIEELSRIEGLGPRSIKRLNDELGIRNVADLERAAKSGAIANLEGFGEKKEQNILRSIGFARSSGGRFLLGHEMPEIEEIVHRIEAVPSAERVMLAGSSRRRKETIGDIDILATSKDPRPIMELFTTMPEVVEVIARGVTKSSVKLRSGINVDLRVIPAVSYGAALNYFTGSKDHNVALRRIAIAKGLKLNEYGLFRETKKIAGRTEEELYRTLGMDYIEPELRENTGEIAAAERHALPNLIGYGSIRGDLQVQTDWTDGSASIEDMARAARNRGLSYIVITDHTRNLAMAHGLDERRLERQMAEIDRINRKLKGSITILKGSECDILKDGRLDLPDRVLAKLDVVGIAVHTFFNLSRRDQTARIVRAMENPNVDILFHPTGRIIGKRPAYDLDIAAIVAAARRTGTILEIDAIPERLDLRDEHIRLCVDAGVKMCIDSDAHAPAHFSFLNYGVAQARRGWATKTDIINAWPLEKMRRSLK
jgi:DNA polymerase (family 10)